MKLSLISFLFALPVLLHAQFIGCEMLLKEGRTALDNKKYTNALNNFLALRDCDETKADTADFWLKETFSRIEAEKNRADSIAKVAQANLEQADKLVKAFYFYDGKFALAYGKTEVSRGTNVFYFIDKQGNRVAKLGEYEKAEQFDEETGFAWVKKKDPNSNYYILQEYLLDSLGRTYRVAYDLENLTPEITALDLRDWKSDTFPTQVLQHPLLKVLLLDGNYDNRRKFGQLPPTFCEKLPNIEVLHLDRCGLDSLPTALGSLSKLRILNVDNNETIRAIPRSLEKCASLQILSLSRAAIDILSIDSLPNLEVLNASNCHRLHQLPNTIGNLPKLRVLDVSDSGLDTLNAAIGKAQRLEELDLSGCDRLHQLPDAIGDLPKLRVLDVSDSGLDTLNAAIGKAQRLEELDLSGCYRLHQLPEAIGDLTKLRVLNASGNNSTGSNISATNPSYIWHYSNINDTLDMSNGLDMRGNDYPDIVLEEPLDNNSMSIETLPISIGKMQSLTLLDLSDSPNLDWASLCQALATVTRKIRFTTGYEYNTDPALLLVKVSKLPSVIPAEIGLLQNAIVELDFTQESITNLPAEIGNLNTLSRLYLGKNQLAKLPHSIGQLNNLENLQLWNNRLNEYPIEIGNLTNLKVLNISKNQIVELPKNIKNLINLKDFYILSNNLYNLPDEIGNLHNLKNLYLNNNQIIELPRSIGQLNQLLELYAGSNMLKVLPTEISNLGNLQKLYLSKNQLIELPHSIGQLHQLQELQIWGNQLSTLPAEIGNLQLLKILGVSQNQLIELPSSIGQLNQLQELYIWNNKLDTLPNEIGNLHNLQKLYIANNQLTSLPHSIGQLIKLQKLYIWKNELNSLPSEIGDLHDLQKLYINNNRLTELPYSIGQLNQLQELQIWGNQLRTLPAEIGNLQLLKVLGASQNDLTELPPSIGQLSNLTLLDIRDNPNLNWASLCHVLSSVSRRIRFTEGYEDNTNITLTFRDRSEDTVLLIKVNFPSKIPTEIGLLQNLEGKFDLSSKNITNLPSEIGNLHNLQELYLNQNQLAELPPSIGQLNQLRELQILNNNLKILPAEIGNLRNLRKLYLSGNQLVELPRNIWQLPRLVILDVRQNPDLNWANLCHALAAVPRKIRFTTSDESNTDTTVLLIRINFPSVIPAEIGLLQNLVGELEFSGKDITALSAEIVNLHNLYKLHINNNQLTDFPSSICQLKQLQELQIMNNKLSTLPAEIGNLHNLQKLYLSGNQLAELPRSIGQLPKLILLDIRDNPGLNWSSLCQTLAVVPRKIRITTSEYASSTDTTVLLIKVSSPLEVPAEIGLLYNLEELSFSQAYIRGTLPSEIGNLYNLKELNLSYNRLTELPNSIGQLRNLTSLRLEGNELTSLPTEMSRLNKLKDFSLSYEYIRVIPDNFFSWTITDKVNYDIWIKACANSGKHSLAHTIYEGIKNIPNLPKTDYGDLSWWFVFAHEFEGAIWAGERYVAGGGNKVGLLSNLAMGYLYNGQYEQAYALYAKYKNEGESGFLADLAEVAAANVPPKKPEDVERIIQFLHE